MNSELRHNQSMEQGPSSHSALCLPYKGTGRGPEPSNSDVAEFNAEMQELDISHGSGPLGGARCNLL